MKTHKSIVLRFWIKSGVDPLCVCWAHVSLVLYLPSEPPPSKDLTLTSGINTKVTSSILSEEFLRGRLLRVAQLSRGGGQVGGPQSIMVLWLILHS